MYKTIGCINDGKVKKAFTYYHFGKKPQVPTRDMQEDWAYEITIIWNVKVDLTHKLLLKCLFHKCETIPLK